MGLKSQRSYSELLMFSSVVDVALLMLALSFGGFLLVFPSILNLILLCELSWVSLYFYGTLSSSVSDSLLLLIWFFFLLCLAASESALGLGILLLKFSIDGHIQYSYGTGLGSSGVRSVYSSF